MLRELLSSITSNNTDDPPLRITADPWNRVDDALNSLIPAESNVPYDIKDVIHAVADDSYFSKCTSTMRRTSLLDSPGLTENPCASLPTSLLILRGVWISQLRSKAHGSSDFATRSIFQLITFEDVPGFLPGTNQEFGGSLKHGAKLLFAFAEATVPEDYCHHAQGVRRGLLCDGEQAHPDRHQFRLSNGGDCGDGTRRGCEHHLLSTRTCNFPGI